MGVVAVAVTTPYSIIHAYILHMVFKTFYFVKKEIHKHLGSWYKQLRKK